jgi:thiosulfate/3-mercaptopyruvate sulfurtransferase
MRRDAPAGVRTMKETPLVTTQWLQDHLGDSNVRILEVCSLTDDKAYREGHVPGAQWVYWKAACWHETDREFIAPDAMARLFGDKGIGPDDTLVLYGDPVQYGSYAFWTYTMAGHRNLKLLDGGRRKWVMEGRPLTPDVPRLAAVGYPAPAANAAMRVGRRNVLNHLKAPQRLLLDVRSSEEYTGQRVIEYSQPFDHGAERFGRIPGAAHLYYKEMLNADDSFKSPEELRAAFAKAGIAPEKFDEIVCYCRLSHRATIAWLALSQVMGLGNVKIYDGSWTEWASIVGYPIEK